MTIFWPVGSGVFSAKAPAHKDKMEFDVESFMSDVTAALSHESPEGWAEVTAEDEANPHGDNSEYEEFIQYPAEESSDPPPDSYGFEVSNECLGVEPALFDLCM